MIEFYHTILEEAGSDPENLYNYMKNELGYKSPKHRLLDDNIIMNTY